MLQLLFFRIKENLITPEVGYEGELGANNVFHGHGTYVWSNGGCYDINVIVIIIYFCYIRLLLWRMEKRCQVGIWNYCFT